MARDGSRGARKARIATAAAAALCGGFIGATFVGAQAGPDGTLYACKDADPNHVGAPIHFIAPDDQCDTNAGQTFMSWNSPGPAGPAGPPGPEGPAGPPGPRGPDADIKTRAVVESTNGERIGPATAIARCRTGEHVLSGGFTVNSDFNRAEFFPNENRPTADGKGWIVVMQAFFSARWRVNAIAICGSQARVAP